MKTSNLIVAVIVALLQVHQAYSFYSIFQSNPSPNTQTQEEPAQAGEQGAQVYQQQQHPNHHHHGGHGGGQHGAWGNFNFGMGFFDQTKKLLKQQLNQLGGMGLGGMGLGGMGLGGQMQMQNYMPHHQFQLSLIPGYVAYLVNGRQEFYSNCGSTSRHCEWAQRVKSMTTKIGGAHQHQVQDAKVELEYVCLDVKHVCVGNTEKCINNSTCDVAMKITEVTLEINGKPEAPYVSSLTYLNNCSMEAQSVTDTKRMPHMLFAIGFTTYDQSGKTLECRRPKASDFKLVFLWNNSTVERSGQCMRKPAHKQALYVNEPELMSTINAWPQICKAIDKAEGPFNLKSFLNHHAPVAQFTSSFSSPFSFADNFEPQYSSDGMVITGAVPN